MTDNKLTILLIEDDLDACEELRSYIETREDVMLQNMTNDSSIALDMVRAGLPDAVILDLELHQGGGNGFQFLSGLKEMLLSHRPYILVTTNNSSNITYEQARLLGADFIMAKHESQYSAQYVIEFLRMMRSVIATTNAPTPESTSKPSEDEILRQIIYRIHRELDFVGVSPKAIGYQYLTDAILLTFQDPQPNVCRKLSEKYRKTDVSIERAMQNAINRAWHTCDPDQLLEHYSARIRSDKGVPTLMEFIYYYVNILKLDFGG